MEGFVEYPSRKLLETFRVSIFPAEINMDTRLVVRGEAGFPFLVFLGDDGHEFLLGLA